MGGRTQVVQVVSSDSRATLICSTYEGNSVASSALHNDLANPAIARSPSSSSSTTSWSDAPGSKPDLLTGGGDRAQPDSVHGSSCNCYPCICRSALNARRNAPVPSQSLATTLWPQPGGKSQPLSLNYSYTPNFLDSIIGLSNRQVKASIEKAFSIFAKYVPITFVEMPDRGPSTQVLRDQSVPAKPNEPQLRFHYADLDHDTGRDVLGEAYFPGEYWSNSGDIFFDNEQWSVGLFVETALHEIGHALGMEHVTGANAIMNPIIESRFNRLENADLLPYDIQTIRAAYGNGRGSVVSQGGKGSQRNGSVEFGEIDTDNLYLQRGMNLVGLWSMADNGQVESWTKVRDVQGRKVVAVGDFNGDGADDLVLQRGTGAVSIWTLSGSGRVRRSTSVRNANGLRVVAAGDMNGDGQDDLILQRGTRAVGIWAMGKAGKVRGWIPVRNAKGLSVVAAGDFSGDDQDDLVLQRGTGRVGIWQMKGDGTVRRWTPIQVDTNGYGIVGAGNFAGSDRDDLVLQLGTGRAGIWTMNGINVQGWITISSTPNGLSIIA